MKNLFSIEICDVLKRSPKLVLMRKDFLKITVCKLVYDLILKKFERSVFLRIYSYMSHIIVIFREEEGFKLQLNK